MNTDDRIQAIASAVRPTGREGGSGTIDLRINVPGPGSDHSGGINALDRETGQISAVLMLSDWGHLADVVAKISKLARARLEDGAGRQYRTIAGPRERPSIVLRAAKCLVEMTARTSAPRIYRPCPAG